MQPWLIQKRPFVAVVAAYGDGLMLAQWFDPPLSALLIVLVLLLVLALVLKKLRRHLVWPLLAVIGGTNLAIHTAVRSPGDLRVVLGDEPAVVTVRGTLAERPRLKIVEKHGQEVWHCVARVRVRELRRESDPGRTDDFHPATGEIWVTIPALLDVGFFAGQPVQIAGAIQHPPLRLAEGLFDFQNYLATRGIYYELETDSPDLGEMFGNSIGKLWDFGWAKRALLGNSFGKWSSKINDLRKIFSETKLPPYSGLDWRSSTGSHAIGSGI